jgi:hypothetical protein
MVGLPTGEVFVVLDSDIKDGKTGLDTLRKIGFPLWFETATCTRQATACTPIFRFPSHRFATRSGSAVGRHRPLLRLARSHWLCHRADTGKGYSWDPVLGIDTPLAAVPVALLPKEPVRSVVTHRPAIPHGLSPYTLATLDDACRKIIGAANGGQEATINGEAFNIGTLTEIPPNFALDMLRWAARRVPSHLIGRDGKRRLPWTLREPNQKVKNGFAARRRHPRQKGRRYA